jgi:hypothetical protein
MAWSSASTALSWRAPGSPLGDGGDDDFGPVVGDAFGVAGGETAELFEEAGLDASVEVVWHDAGRAGVVSEAEASQIDVTRVVGVPMPRVARHLGVSTAAAHKRRQRAEARLRACWDDGSAA